MAETNVILCERRPIPEKEQHDLQIRLAKGEAKTLVRIVESRLKDELAHATNAMLQAAGPAPLKVNLADEHLKNARRYNDFLIILQQIKDQTQPFTISKWT